MMIILECDFDLDVQMFADADATVAGIHTCMVNYMMLAPSRSGSVVMGYHFQREIDNCFDEYQC